MGKRLFAVVAALGLLVGLVAGVMGAGSAAAETPPQSQSDLIFFPWVPNGETLNNSNAWYGSIVVQNIENVPINVQLGREAGGAFPVSAVISPHAAYTFSAAELAAQLGWTGNGGGVVAAATWVTSQLPSDICQNETGSLVFQRNDDLENLPPGMTKTADQDVLAALPMGATVTQLSWNGGSTTDFTQSGNEITWGATRPADNTQVTAIYTYALCTRGPEIGGIEKQAAPASSGFLVSTDKSMTSVDGYTAIPDTDVAWGVSSKFCQAANPAGVCNNLGAYSYGIPVGGFDGTSYLPIVQGNYSGWDTYIHVTNVDSSTPNGGGAISIIYYQQGQGTGNTAVAVSQLNLTAGQSQTIDIANVVPSGFVGSAWISSQYGIVVSASRVKTTMALTNTNVPSLYATTSGDNGTTNNGLLGVAASCQFPAGNNVTLCQMYAPLVYLNYNGWNTGFNVVNTSESPNTVTINVVNQDGTSVGIFTANIPAKGMQYVYVPATMDNGISSFTSAILTADAPFAATVDEVKYSTGDAMSYNATATLAVAAGQGINSAFFGNSLSLPLYQVGNVDSNSISHGDTSGINLFNPTGNSVTGVVNFYMSTGAAAGSTLVGGGTPFTIGAMGSSLVAYAPTQMNLTPGSQLSAVVTVTGGKGGVVGVSNEVNYDVNGDGGVAFNLMNLDGQYRYACSQTSCGSPVPPVSSFAGKLTLSPTTQSHIVGATATVTATAYGANGQPLAGVPVTFTVSGPNTGTANPNSGTGSSPTDANGVATFTYTNTTAGTDTVSATAPAPNGQTLKSIPPTVNVVWTQPTLNVQVCTIQPDKSCKADNPTTNNTTTVAGALQVNSTYTGSWMYTFTVTGVDTPSDLNTAKLHYTSTGASTTGPENGAITMAQLDGGAWNCSAGTCTATFTNSNINITSLIGKAEVLDWYLDTNGDGTQQAFEPSANDNPTTVNYVAFQALVEVQNPDTLATNPAGFTTTINNTSDWNGVESNAGTFNEVYQFTYWAPIASCSSLNTGTTVLGTATVSDTVGPGPSLTTLTWTGTAPKCVATISYGPSNMSQFDGKVRQIEWQITVGNTTANDGTTTVNYPPVPSLVAKGGSGNGTDWATSYTVVPNNGNYTWAYQFTAAGYPNCSLLSTTVNWKITSGYLSGSTGSYTVMWNSDNAGGCVATTTPDTNTVATLGGKSNTVVFTASGTNPTTSFDSETVTMTWAMP